jgi:hypothetical protein
MSDELSTAKKFVEEVLIDLMTERIMSIFVGVQASSTRMVQASLSTAHGAGPSWPLAEMKTKNKHDLANAKLIPTILTDYIPPLAGAVNRDSVPYDFEYTIVTAYLPKGIRCSSNKPG